MSSRAAVYRVTNQRTARTVARSARRADSLAARTRGLLGERMLAEGSGLWLDPCSSIHMFFMRFAIDVVFLDRDLRVTRAVAAVAPWRVAFGGRGARSALELPVGSIAASDTRAGDLLSFDREP